MINDIEKIASAIKQAITKYKQSGGLNENGFSVDVWRDCSEYRARVGFCEDSSMTIMYQIDTDNETVKSLFDERNDDEISRVSAILWTNNFLSF